MTTTISELMVRCIHNRRPPLLCEGWSKDSQGKICSPRNVVLICIFSCSRYVVLLSPAQGSWDAGAGGVFGGGPTTQAWLPKDGTTLPLRSFFSFDPRTLRCSFFYLTLVASHTGAVAREKEKCVYYRGTSLTRNCPPPPWPP